MTLSVTKSICVVRPLKKIIVFISNFCFEINVFMKSIVCESPNNMLQNIYDL